MPGTVRITGVRELSRVLRRLPRRLREGALMRATQEGARVIRKAARVRAPRGTQPAHPRYGRLHRNLRIRAVPRGRRRAPFEVAIGTGDAFWGRWIETGLADRIAKKSRGASRRGRKRGRRNTRGRHFGPLRAQPFLEPGLRASRETALRAAQASLARDLDRIARQLAGPRAHIGRSLRRKL